MQTRYAFEHEVQKLVERTNEAEHTIERDGRRLTVSDLPPPDTKRWVVRRKAQVVAAVRGGLLSLEQACSRYALNSEEFRSWERCIDRFGVKGLRTTWTQVYLNCGSLEMACPTNSYPTLHKNKDAPAEVASVPLRRKRDKPCAD
jgi:hypothetical protein